MTKGKKLAWLLTVLFAAGLFGAAWPMAQRIAAFNKASHFRHFHTEPVLRRQFQVEGFPPVRLEDAEDESGRFVLRLTYGHPADQAPPGAPPPAVVDIPVNRPPATGLPDLGVFEEWLRVLAINEVLRDEQGQQSVKPDSEKIMIVVRRTPAGFDPGSWGSVRRTEWLFDFYDLQRDGRVEVYTRRWPMAKEIYERRFQERAAAPGADERLKVLAAIPPLEERGLEFFAAMHVIPKLNVPKYKFTDTALSFRVLGWTLPVAMLSGLGLSIAFFFAVAPKRQPLAARPSSQ